MFQLRRTSRDDESKDIPDRPVQWRRMLGYLRPYFWRLMIAFAATAIGAALSLVFPEVIQRVVDSVLEQNDRTTLNRVTLLLLFVFFLRALSSAVERWFLNQAGERVVLDLRIELFSHLIELPLRFYSERRVGELVSRLSSDVTVMRSLLVNNVNTLIQQILVSVGAIAVMFVLNWRLTMFIIGLIPILVLLGFIAGLTMRRYSSKRQDELAAALVITEEVFQGIRETKSFAREVYEKERHDNAVFKAFQATLKLIRVRVLFGPSVIFLGLAALAAILWFGGREVLDGRLTGGELIQFLFYGATVAASLASLGGLYTQFEEAVGATKRIFELLDQQSDIVDKPDAKMLNAVEGRISLSHVTFKYHIGQIVLHDIDLEVASGEIVALVGPSGAGKSTIFNLIPRFYDPDDGAILIDGHDLRDVKLESLRSQIGIVPQETYLFGGTIRENILYGRLDASEDDMIVAAQAANAHKFIMELPDNYETLVGERGVRLSGGQRQRVAIARAILKDPRILLLDEATSSLDNESEHLVQEALARLMQNRTTLIIAHRLSTIRIADRISVIDKGRIVEIGTHDELILQGGLYKYLYEMQFRYQETDTTTSVMGNPQ